MLEEQLLQQLRDRSTRESAFRVLVETYRERLYAHIHRMTYEHADADDVLQNTFIKAWRGLDNFRASSRLYTWLYRIATNEAITLLQQRKRRQGRYVQQLSHAPAFEAVADSVLDGDKALALLQQAVAGLPPKQRAVFNLRYYEEMSYQDISDVVGTSVGGLKASYHHAIKKIESFLLDQDV
jgi:RNA polymerase sigma-70 factor (ECF subfamily)